VGVCEGVRVLEGVLEPERDVVLVEVGDGGGGALPVGEREVEAEGDAEVVAEPLAVPQGEALKLCVPVAQAESEGVPEGLPPGAPPTPPAGARSAAVREGEGDSEPAPPSPPPGEPLLAAVPLPAADPEGVFERLWLSVEEVEALPVAVRERGAEAVAEAQGVSVRVGVTVPAL
jgi:hypothetical protein